jgi:hypothetical protein
MRTVKSQFYLLKLVGSREASETGLSHPHGGVLILLRGPFLRFRGGACAAHFARHASERTTNLEIT